LRALNIVMFCHFIYHPKAARYSSTDSMRVPFAPIKLN
jgi:hypothetical protein